MNRDDVEALARAIDRLMAGGADQEPGAQAALPPGLLHLASYLNESFPRVVPDARRRVRVRQVLLGTPLVPWRVHISVPPELEYWAGRLPLNRRTLGTAAVLTACVLGYAYLRQRAAVQRG